ncbi:STAS/SEC14 domain-containing protein [Algoriphagus sediminis]|uniref:STAS/SEC14 domain-containing protein n=1 Tax=Algoriphagus sediminis TaxID=3057113 RepID=A0ABT7YGL8_9BACT|nr:STAS/SEC14 domain-containing protein [Algoriphagus sediminis]MDN3205616.1 STAS/SEC14 domain-containing protein [Algoriphagus sediminis]
MKVEFFREKGIIQYTIDGKVEEGALIELLSIQKTLPREGNFSILAVVPNFSGYQSLNAILLAIQADLGWIGRAKKYALVSDLGALKTFISVLGKLVPSMKVRVYSFAQEDESRKWLEED